LKIHDDVAECALGFISFGRIEVDLIDVLIKLGRSLANCALEYRLNIAAAARAHEEIENDCDKNSRDYRYADNDLATRVVGAIQVSFGTSHGLCSANCRIVRSLLQSHAEGLHVNSGRYVPKLKGLDQLLQAC